MEETEADASNEEHPADIPSTVYAMEECAPAERSKNGSRTEIVSDRSQTWKEQLRVECGVFAI